MGRDFKMTGEEVLLSKRIRELADTAQRRGIVTFTDFLNLNEQNILHQTLQKFSWIKGETFGGYEGAERQIAAFIPDAFYIPRDSDSISYPISWILTFTVHLLCFVYVYRKLIKTKRNSQLSET